jgi:hypothetical protein
VLKLRIIPIRGQTVQKGCLEFGFAMLCVHFARFAVSLFVFTAKDAKDAQRNVKEYGLVIPGWLQRGPPPAIPFADRRES